MKISKKIIVSAKNTIIASLFCVVPAFAQTTWTAGDTTTATPLDAANWSNGTPTATNPGTITDAVIGVSAAFSPVSASGDSVSLTLGGTTAFSVSGTFIPFSSFTGISNAKGLFELTLRDSATMNVAGNFWGGNNNNTNYARPLDGYDYAAYYTFGDTSTLTVDGEWWVGMSAKAKVVIEDSASVTSTKGNSGIGWDTSANGSLLEMTGGTLKAVNFYVTQWAASGTMNQTGGAFTTTGNLSISKAGGIYTLSGSTATLKVTGTMTNVGTAALSGTAANAVTIGTLTGTGKTTFSGGNATIGTWNLTGNDKIADGAAVTVTTINASSGSLTIEGAASVLNATNFYIGITGNSTGSITLNSGAANLTGAFQMGSIENAVGKYTQTGGTLTQSGTEKVLIGTEAGSSSTLDISGGNFNLGGTFYLSDQDTAGATLNISGTAALSTKEVHLGQHGNATATMSGTSTWTTNGSAFFISMRDGVSNGTLNLTENASLTTGNFRMSYAQEASSTTPKDAGTSTLNMSGNSKLTINGTFIPFEYIQGTTSTGCANVTLSGSAQMYVSGNFWGGANDANRYVKPQDGKEYAAYYTFSDSSSLSVNEWWVAMTAKTYVLIEDDATVTSRDGNSGLGWQVGAAGSLLEMTGGTLKAPSFAVGAAAESSMNLSGGTAELTTLKIASEAGAAGSVLTISGSGLLKSTTANVGILSSGSLEMTGGSTDIGTLNVASGAGSAGSSVSVSGTGKLKATTANVGTTSAAAVNLTGGTAEIGTLNLGSAAVGTLSISAGTAAVTTLNSGNAGAGKGVVELSGTGKLVVTDAKLGKSGVSNVMMSGSSVIEATNFILGDTSTANVTTVSTLSMTDNASLKVTGEFVPFKNFTSGHSGRVEITLDGNASIYSNGNFWGGTNAAKNVVSESGYDYAAYYTFGGNSSFSSNEWWVAMSAKTYVLIKDNATVTSRGGNSGIAWGTTANGSVVEMTGGTLKAPAFIIGNEEACNGTLNISGGAAELKALTVSKVSSLNLSGTGDLYSTSIMNNGTFNVAQGGRLQVGTIGAATGQTLTLAGSAAYNMDGNIVLDVFSLTDFDKVAYTGTSDVVLGDDAGIILNLANATGINDTDAFEIDDWATGFDVADLQSLAVSVEGIAAFTGYINAEGNIVFGSVNALPEPNSLLLLLLGVLGLGWGARRNHFF